MYDDLSAIIDYTPFEGYNIIYMSCIEGYRFIPTQELQIVDFKNCDILNIINTNLDSLHIHKSGHIIYRDRGLYEFDNRLFEPNWYEDFDKKINKLNTNNIFLFFE